MEVAPLHVVSQKPHPVTSAVCFLLSRVWLCVTPMDCQKPLPMEFSRQEYWSGLPFPTLGDLHDPEIEPRSPALQVDSLPSEPPGETSLNKSVRFCYSNKQDWDLSCFEQQTMYFFLFKKHLFIWLCKIFGCSMWDLAPRPGITPGPPVLRR